MVSKNTFIKLFGVSLGTALLASLLHADALSDILSPEKKEIFRYKEEQNDLESSKLKKSWVNPLHLQYKKNFSEQFVGKTLITENYSVTIDQPIFKSGGIYHSIKYANAIRGANAAQIELLKREMIGNAVEILFNMRKIRLQQRKLRLLIQNDEIDITLKSDSFNAGILDSSFLDQAILKRNADETELLASEIEYQKLKSSFAMLSHRDPESFALPKLKLIGKYEYRNNNLELQKDRLTATEKNSYSKMTMSKYLPEVSVQAQYINGDPNPLYANPNLKDEYNTYGVTVSMPLSINTFDDVESSRMAYLEAATQVIDREKSVELEYNMVLNNLRIIDRKITLDRKDERLYQRLYTVTKNLEKAGEKTAHESRLMHNSLKIKKLDQQIHTLDKQIQLLLLYTKVANVL